MNQLSAEGVILVAYDGSPHSEAALEWAAATAALEGRSVRAASVAEARASADADIDDDLQKRFEAVLAASGAGGTFDDSQATWRQFSWNSRDRRTCWSPARAAVDERPTPCWGP